MRTPFLLTCSLIVVSLLSTLGANAQERTSHAAFSQDSNLQGTYAKHLQNDTSNLSAKTQVPCTDGGVSHTNGTTWVDACPTGTTGTGMTRVCVKGVTATQQNNCTGQLPCGAHPGGSTWAGSCPSPTSGNLTYRCVNGTTYIDSTQTNCASRDCSGQAYSAACPSPTADGINLTGNMNFQCVHNGDGSQNMTMTGNTCRGYQRPCGSVPDGGSQIFHCADVGGAGYLGDLTLTCHDSMYSVSTFGCTLKSWHIFNINYPDKTCTTSSASSGTSSYGSEIDQSCTVSVANLPTDLRSKLTATLGTPANAPLASLKINYNVTNGSGSANYSLTDDPACAGSANCYDSGTNSSGSGSCTGSSCGESVGTIVSGDKCFGDVTEFASTYNFNSRVTYGQNYTLNITGSRNGGCGGISGPTSSGITNVSVSGLVYY